MTRISNYWFLLAMALVPGCMPQPASAASGAGNVASVTPHTAGIPVAPSLLAATTVGATTVNLVWRDESTNETSFRVQRLVVNLDKWKTLSTVASTSDSTRGLFYLHADLELEPGPYCYRLGASNGIGTSYSSSKCVTLEPSDWSAVPPPAPTGMQIDSATTTYNAIGVTFVDASTHETGFSIERRKWLTGAWEAVATLEAHSGTGMRIAYVDEHPQLGVRYCYRAHAVNSAGSRFGASACGTTAGLATPSPWPDDSGPILTAIVAQTDGNLRVLWADGAEHTEWDIWRLAHNEGWERIGSVRDHRDVADDTRTAGFTATGLTAGQAYCFRVERNGSYESENLLCSAALLPPNERRAVPDTPGEVWFSSLGNHRVTVHWDDHWNNELGFIVERRQGTDRTALAGEWMSVVGADVVGTGKEYSVANTTLDSGTEYCYRILPFNASGVSSTYETCVRTTADRPLQPRNLRVVSQTAKTVTLQWDDRTINEEGYRIHWTGERSGYVDDDGSAKVGVNDNRYTLRGHPGFTYCMRVYAFNEFGASAPSNEACVTLGDDTPPPQPVPEETMDCGIGCRAGFHAVEFTHSLSCSGDGVRPNQTRCRKTTEQFISPCGIGCPAGYMVIRYEFDLSCVLDEGAGLAHNKTLCQRLP